MLKEILHTAGQILEIPCIVVLLGLIVAAVWQVGDLIVEYIFERRKFKENVLELMKKLSGAGTENALAVIDKSTLLKRQKRLAHELISARNMPENTLTAFAQELLGRERTHYEKSLTPTELVTKLGPMFGLLGTLIPLGPGIIALGVGDTETLSAAIGVAFDTTIAGLITAAVCFVLSHIRRRWYTTYMGANEAIAECLLEEVSAANAEKQTVWGKAANC